LQRDVVQSRCNSECLLDRRKAAVAIHPGECAAQLQQRPHLLVVAAVLSRVVSSRREIIDRTAHRAHGTAKKSELLEQAQSRGNAFVVREPLGDVERARDIPDRFGIGVSAGLAGPARPLAAPAGSGPARRSSPPCSKCAASREAMSPARSPCPISSRWPIVWCKYRRR